MRADRLLSLLFLLQSNGRMTAPDLARTLEVSTRTVLRDVEALSSAGVPVWTERGRGGGISLVENWRTDVTGFTTHEARALFSGAVGTNDPQRPAWESAVRKLLAATPAAHREPFRRAAERILVEPLGWRARQQDPPHLPGLQEAVFSARRVRLTYRSAGARRASTRSLDPVGLVAKGGTWYLVAVTATGERLFRVDRVEDVAVLDDPVAADLPDLPGVWARLRAEVERQHVPGVAVRLRVRPEDVGLVLRIADAQLVAEPEVSGTGEFLLVAATFRALPAARAVLLGLGPLLTVLDPPELVADLVRTARDVLRTYGQADADRAEA
ncbi:helix-turn-helix transcriptional regulator [Kineococcus rhizosphaerae]|uniref:Putative DNA-binding transcriptional regulator YafY n=1 Tax=Kineococcus rhizosphaerae TaxID=559628 RepID=A0A2T0R1T4_9ACTN|nr:WYL domain-containing protein [Kineococcus rhizosphaerae]PRY13481.1 putative DNA-binding transcriptional regulator YafY [Kineococcus rhizosphaerae]